MAENENSGINAKIRADLVEDVRKIVREENTNVGNQLGDIREKLGELVGTTKTHSWVLTGIFLGILGLAYTVLRIKAIEAPQSGAAAESARGAGEATSAPKPQLVWLQPDGGLESVPPEVVKRTAHDCFSNCKLSEPPVPCATLCASNSCWTWCRRLAIESDAELRQCVASCFNRSTSREPLKSIYQHVPPELEPEDAAVPDAGNRDR